MQAAINQTIDFLQSIQMQKTAKTEADSSASEKKGEISSDSKKSFSQLVDDAKKSGENTEISEKKLQNSSETKVAEKNPEMSGKNEEVKFKNADEKIEKNTKIFGFQKQNKTSRSDLKNNQLNLKENQKTDLTNNEKVKVKINDFTLNDQKNLKKIKDEPEKLKVKNPKIADSDEKILKNDFTGDELNLLSTNLLSENQDGLISAESNLDTEKDFTIENVKNKGKTFSLDKDGKITVNDLRTEKTDENKNDNKLEIKDVKFDGKNSIEMNVELSTQTASSNILSSDSQTASSDGSNFQAMLQNQIQENADTLVKAGNIVLKDNNAGEIKLILHPEALGNVKFDLQVKDNNISGRIIVQSQEAFEAFKQSVESLKMAFVQSGFETAGFDLSFAGQNNGQNQAEQNQRNKANQINRAFAYEGSVSDDDYFEFEQILENSYTNSVNIVA